LRVGVEIGGEHHVQIPSVVELLDETCRRDRLQLAFACLLKLPARVVKAEEQWPERIWSHDLGHQRSAGETSRLRSHVEIELAHVADGPAARERMTLSLLDIDAVARFSLPLVDDMVVRAEYVDYLVVVVVDYRLRKGDQVGPEGVHTLAKESPPLLPVTPSSPQVLGHDAHGHRLALVDA
jgi:hypothetical protein